MNKLTKKQKMDKARAAARAASRAWYQSHKASNDARAKKWKDAHPDAWKQYQRVYHAQWQRDNADYLKNKGTES